jgi:hypothetical protein
LYERCYDLLSTLRNTTNITGEQLVEINREFIEIKRLMNELCTDSKYRPHKPHAVLIHIYDVLSSKVSGLRRLE